MTIDDESSIYVGGLPYDATEESIRRVFDLYGSVVAVKIINDHSTRGKCYGFVTFTNPRSAVDAINDMNGRTIDGRVIKVNGVRTRGGTSNFNRESFQHKVERGTDWDRGRDQERGYDRERNRYRERNNDWSRERDRSRDHDRERERGYGHSRVHVRERDPFLTRDIDEDGDMVDNAQEHSRNHEEDWERDRDLDVERVWDRTNGRDTSVDNDKDRHSNRQNGFDVIGSHGREISPESIDDYDNQEKEEFESLTHRIDELRKEISQMEERVEEKQKLIMDLQIESKKLEDDLIASKKNTSYNQTQLTKMYKCFRQVKDHSERLKSCEEELQALVDTAKLETDADDVGLRDGNA